MRHKRENALGHLDAIDLELARRGLDGVIAVSPENVRYASDVIIPTQSLLKGRLAFVLWPRRGSPSMLVATNEASYVTAASWIDDVRTYVELVDDPVAVLARMLREHSLDHGRIAIETDYLPAEPYLRLSRELPGLRIEPATDLFASVRMRKTSREKALITHAFKATESALLQTFARAREGDTERMLALRLAGSMLEAGADHASFIFLTAGPNAGYAHKLPGDYKLRRGDFVKADVGSMHAMYRTNVGRTAIVGEPSAAHAASWKHLCEVHRAVADLCRAGRTGREVFEQARMLQRQAGFEHNYPHHGHGIGLDLHERPALRPTEVSIFEPGMILTIETRHREPGKLGMQMEDLIEITDQAPIWHTGRPEPAPLIQIA